MKKGGYFFKTQKSRFIGCGFGEIEICGNNRTNIFPVQNFLGSELTHPGTGSFTFSWEKIHVKDSKVRTISILNFKYLNIRMIFGNVFLFLKSNSPKSIGNVKCTFSNVFENKIGANSFFINIIIY